jgi:hypothetical protein
MTAAAPSIDRDSAPPETAGATIIVTAGFGMIFQIILRATSGLVVLAIGLFFGFAPLIDVTLGTAALTRQDLWLSVLSLTLMALGLSFLCNAILGIVDFCRRGPLLIIDDLGLRDVRLSPELIPWADIATYCDIFWGGAFGRVGLVLTLRQDATAFKQRGTALLRQLANGLPPRPRSIYISLEGLSPPYYRVRQAIKKRVDDHGGRSVFAWWRPKSRSN